MAPKATRSEDVILQELTAVGQAITKAEANLAQLYPRRLALFQEAKDHHGTINRVLGEAASCAETAVIATLRKAKQKDQAS